jgi:Icc-related predicted phosphoesterase
VFGNHNLEDFGRYHGKNSAGLPAAVESDKGIGAMHADGKVKMADGGGGGVIIAGLGGSMRYNRAENQWTNAQMMVKIIKLMPKLLFYRIFHGRCLDVLLTHSPPEGIHDKSDPCHRGFKAFLWFMKVFKPKYLVHGHIHLYDMSEVRTSRYLETTVVNAYGHCVIEL